MHESSPTGVAAKHTSVPNQTSVEHKYMLVIFLQGK